MKIEIPTIPLISICTGSGLNQKYTDPEGQILSGWSHCMEAHRCTAYNSYYVLVHKGNVVTVEGGITHEPKASALSVRDLLHFLSALTNP